MWLKNIFDVFSRRQDTQSFQEVDIPIATRGRVLMWCGDIFSNRRSYSSSGDYTHQFWEEIHRFLQMRHGRPWLSGRRGNASNIYEDATAFLVSCDSADFLDFLEYIFRVECYFHVAMSDVEVVGELNEILAVDNLPYYVTEFVRQEVRQESQDGTQGQRPFPLAGTVIKTLAYPKVVCRDSDVVHAQAIEPALKVLQSPIFASANQEFLSALEDFRKGDFSDCLVKCGSSLESVMKIVCDQKGWPHAQNDTAGALVRAIVQHSNLESYFENTLLIVATLRNRLGSAHGAGTASRHVPRHLASYAINMTASSILLLASETGLERA